MREGILFVLAGVLAILTIFLVSYLTLNLLSNLNKALNIELAPVSATQFDIEGFEKLNLVK